MLHDFIRTHQSELVAHATATFAGERGTGVPLFLSQVAETLRTERPERPFTPDAIGAGAARYARELLAQGCSVSRVVHDYSGACEAVTWLAAAEGVEIAAGEFHTLGLCLDAAISDAVTEYGRLKDEASWRDDRHRRGQLAHDLRNLVQTALLSFKVIEAGGGTSGRPCGVLGRSLAGIQVLAERIASDAAAAELPLAPPRLDRA